VPYRFRNDALAPLLVAVLAGAVLSARQPEVLTAWIDRAALPVHRQSIPVESGPPIELSVASSGTSAAVARLIDTSTRALRLYAEWLGPLTPPALAVVDLPWGHSPGDAAAPGAAYPNTAATRMHWLAPERDLTAERSLIAAIARQFWWGPRDEEAWFREGLAIYTAMRGIHAALEGRNFAAPRWFGGFISFPLRSLLMSPSPVDPRPKPGEFDEVMQPADAPWRFAAVHRGSPARRTADALRTLERLIGWPAMQQALFELRARAAGGPMPPEMLGAVLAEQRGVPMQWFVRDLVRGGNTIDYAVAGVQSDGVDGTTRTTVTVHRRGGVFAGSDAPGQAGSVPLLIRFEDGSEVRSFVDGRAERSAAAFDSSSPARSATIDPDLVMLIDADRSNNARFPHGAPRDPIGLRLVLNWVIWLQHAMLTYTAIA
jgi:hypothetical protein